MIQVLPGSEGLIFDCDGTLADTMPIHTEAWRETLRSYGRDCPVEFLEPLRGMPAEEIVVRFNRTYGTEFNPKEVADAKNKMTHERLKLSKPIVPVAGIAIDYQNKLPMAVVSGGTRKNVLRTLKAIRMSDFFKAVITADDGLKPKPDPQMFLEAAKRMNVDPKLCEVFEDGDLGLQAARSAGMRAVDVRPYLS